MTHVGHYSHSSTGFASRSEVDVIEFIDVSALADIEWPFQRIDSFPHDSLRETAYEILVMSCRSSPGFGGRVPLTYHSSNETSTSDEVMPVVSKIKKSLGLKTKRSTTMVAGSSSVSKRHVTLANVMRQQMKAIELTDHRLRKTLTRTLVGQTGRKLETVILPLELLRQLQPSEFSDTHEYHLWQKRQLKILQLGLLDHSTIPVDESDSSCSRLREIIQSGETKPIDTSKNSETICTLCQCVMDLAWRENTQQSCHWIDGFPINVHIYVMLLQAIFDHQEETFVLDEVDDMMDLMKKTWAVLGISKSIHNVCFAWVLLKQFVVTGQIEQDFLRATQVVLTEIVNEKKKCGGNEQKDPIYDKMMSSLLISIQGWVEKKMLDYHERFGMVNGLKLMENVLSLSLTTAEINHMIIHKEMSENLVESESEMDVSRNHVDCYVRSSLRNAFNKVTKQKKTSSTVSSEYLIQLASEIEKLAMKEEECFSVILKKYHPIPAGVAAATLHKCYNEALKQYVSRKMKLAPDIIKVLQTAGKLENLLIQMVVDNSIDCSDGGKNVVREMVPYEVESILLGLIRTWMDKKLEIGRECLNKVKDSEAWTVISKEEKHARSAGELIAILRAAVDDLFEIPIAVSPELVKEFAHALESLIKEYATFTGSCGLKRSYTPKLPPLTRCNKESRFRNVWRIVRPCRSGIPTTTNATGKLESDHRRPSTSRGTRRLYVRLNTLHYLSCNLHLFEHSLSLHNPQTPSTTDIDHTIHTRPRQRRRSSISGLSYSTHRFDRARTAIQSAIQHVAEVAAARLIFFDSNHFFHEAIYTHDVSNARIRPALRTLKQNLTLLNNVTIEHAQPLLIQEVMKASFDAFLVVLLAGGNERAFSHADHEMVAEDFEGLKRVFATCGDRILEEELVNQEANVVEGIIALMGMPTEQLVDDFSLIACKANGLIGIGCGGSLEIPMPPTTGKWKSTDPNTLLRVLCYRNDDISDRFLKKTFQLPKRR